MNRKTIPISEFLILAILIASIALSGCAYITGEAPEKTTPAQPQINVDVTAAEAYDLIQNNLDNADFIIVDVRTPEEYADGHIENAVNINFNSGIFRDEIDKLDKDDTYLIYCRTGSRSTAARNIMLELGFKYIYHMDGGITEWQAVGLPIEH